jgi:hypothetical protein
VANGNGNGKVAIKDIGILLTAIASGVAGSYGYRQINDPRPDPFTATMAREMEVRLRRDIERVEEMLDEHLHFSQRKVEFYDKTLVEHTKDIITLRERCDRAFRER